MNKKRLGAIIAFFVIVSGLMVAVFPLLDYWYVEYVQNRFLDRYRQQFPLDETPDADADSFLANMTESTSQEEISSSLSSSSSAANPREEDVMEFTVRPEDLTSPTSTVNKETDLTVIGAIEIPKIGVNIPIFKYSTQYQMDFGAVHVEGTTGIGKVGNCGIAAHRGRAKWYFFNRLDELVAGDRILIHHEGEIYEYTVYESLLVYPHQTEVLNRSRTKKVLTLITCHPPGADTYRLIIHALQND